MTATFVRLCREAEAIDDFKDNFRREYGGRVGVEHPSCSEPVDPLPPHDEPLDEGYEYICRCMVNEEGEVDCLSRVALLDLERGVVTPLNFDEDFLISSPRNYSHNERARS
jgi:hypothetical protein